MLPSKQISLFITAVLFSLLLIPITLLAIPTPSPGSGYRHTIPVIIPCDEFGSAGEQTIINCCCTGNGMGSGGICRVIGDSNSNLPPPANSTFCSCPLHSPLCPTPSPTPTITPTPTRTPTNTSTPKPIATGTPRAVATVVPTNPPPPTFTPVVSECFTDLRNLPDRTNRLQIEIDSDNNNAIDSSTAPFDSDDLELKARECGSEKIIRSEVPEGDRYGRYFPDSDSDGVPDVIDGLSNAGVRNLPFERNGAGINLVQFEMRDPTNLLQTVVQRRIDNDSEFPPPGCIINQPEIIFIYQQSDWPELATAYIEDGGQYYWPLLRGWSTSPSAYQRAGVPFATDLLGNCDIVPPPPPPPLPPPPSGCYEGNHTGRLWLKNDTQLRNPKPIQLGGDFIPSWSWMPLSLFRARTGSSTRHTIFIEGMYPGNMPISIVERVRVTCDDESLNSEITVYSEDLTVKIASLSPSSIDRATWNPVSGDEQGGYSVVRDYGGLVGGAITDGAAAVTLPLEQLYFPSGGESFLSIAGQVPQVSDAWHYYNSSGRQYPQIFGGFAPMFASYRPNIPPGITVGLLPQLPMSTDLTETLREFKSTIEISPMIVTNREGLGRTLPDYKVVYVPPSNFISTSKVNAGEDLLINEFNRAGIVSESSRLSGVEVAPMKFGIYRRSRNGDFVKVLESPFNLRRPPVLLVHGIWGSGDESYWPISVWDEERAELPTRIYRLDYSRSNTLGYSENYTSVKKAIFDILEEYTSGVSNTSPSRTLLERYNDWYYELTPEEKAAALRSVLRTGEARTSFIFANHSNVRGFHGIPYAAKRIDIVAHSMGGQLVRLAIADFNNNLNVVRQRSDMLPLADHPVFGSDFDHLWEPAAVFPGNPSPSQDLRIKIWDWPTDYYTYHASYLNDYNLGAGSIRRFIPVGSPFKGSPLAWLAERIYGPRPYRAQIGDFEFWGYIQDAIRDNDQETLSWAESNGFVIRIPPNSYQIVYPTAHADLAPGSTMQRLLETPGIYPEGRRSVAWAPIVGITKYLTDAPFNFTTIALGAMSSSFASGQISRTPLIGFFDSVARIHASITRDFGGGWLPNGTHDDLTVPAYSQRNACIPYRVTQTMNDWTLVPYVEHEYDWIKGAGNNTLGCQTNTNTGLGINEYQIGHSLNTVETIRYTNALQTLAADFGQNLESEQGGSCLLNRNNIQGRVYRRVAAMLRSADGIPAYYSRINIGDDTQPDAYSITGFTRGGLGQ